jgi:hypothetical protein
MPFVAALSYCQHISAGLPPAPQVAKGNTTPINAIAAGPYERAEETANQAYSTCMNMLTERLQYGSGLSGAYQTLHQEQADSCTADVKAGYLDEDPQFTFAGANPRSGSCQSEGRSALQARRDYDFRGTQQNFFGVVLAGADKNTVISETLRARKDMDEFSDYVKKERETLSNSVAAAANAIAVYTNTLGSTPTQ